jgi:hypothetical protein
MSMLPVLSSRLDILKQTGFYVLSSMYKPSPEIIHNYLYDNATMIMKYKRIRTEVIYN